MAPAQSAIVGRAARSAKAPLAGIAGAAIDVPLPETPSDRAVY